MSSIPGVDKPTTVVLPREREREIKKKKTFQTAADVLCQTWKMREKKNEMKQGLGGRMMMRMLVLALCWRLALREAREATCGL